MIMEAIDQLQDYTEPRTFICAKRCGEEFVVRFPESVVWDDYELTALTDAGWVLRDGEYFCPAHREDES